MTKTKKDCHACEGTGIRLEQNGEDDFNREICDICDGTGRAEPASIDEFLANLALKTTLRLYPTI